jgi:hypothetical protein
MFIFAFGLPSRMHHRTRETSGPDGRTPSGTDLPSGPLVQLAGRRCKGWLPNTGIQVFEHIEFPDTAGPLQLLRPGS